MEPACYAQGQVGDLAGQPNLFMNAVGVYLKVDCLYVPDRKTDFSNWEMWMGSDRMYLPGEPGWLEEGMTSGTVYNADGGVHEGFVWFWAQAVPGGIYDEFYVQNATVGNYTNVAFYGASSGNWDVHLNGNTVGRANGVGFSVGSEVGAESTTTAAVFKAQATNWGYYDTGHRWNLMRNSVPFNNGQGFQNVAAYNSDVTASTDAACGSNAATPGTISQARSGSGNEPTADTAKGLALQFGESAPARATYVETTIGLASHGAVLVDPGRKVFCIQMSGTFKSRSARAPRGRSAPAGKSLEVYIDSTTGGIVGYSLRPSARDLSTLGVAHSLL